jgi:hypothetical protein
MSTHNYTNMLSSIYAFLFSVIDNISCEVNNFFITFQNIIINILHHERYIYNNIH